MYSYSLLSHMHTYSRWYFVRSEPHNTHKENARCRGAEDMSVIDEEAALTATGENRLESIRQLIMRGKKLASFERSCAIRLQSLTVSRKPSNDIRA